MDFLAQVIADLAAIVTFQQRRAQPPANQADDVPEERATISGTPECEPDQLRSDADG